MKLDIPNEYAPLKSVALSYGSTAPDFSSYRGDDPEYAKYHDRGVRWDRDLLVKQQDVFFQLLDSSGVELQMIPPQANLIWQTYTRDVAFVCRDRLYFNRNRRLREREGEVDILLDTLRSKGLSSGQQQEILTGHIEGGDVMPTERGLWLGESGRSNKAAISELRSAAGAPQSHIFDLGDQVMHLDTRMTQIGSKQIIAYLPAFKAAEQSFLQSHYEVFELSEAEMKRLASNVFVIDPDTIVIESREDRLKTYLDKKGWRVHALDYSEPIKLGGSFRCTTLPLYRQS